MNGQNNANTQLARNRTFDSAGTIGAGQEVVTLASSAFGTNEVPKYTLINDRPDFGPSDSSFGLLFDGSRRDSIQGNRFGTPETSISAQTSGGTADYRFVLDRGMQFWAKPTVVPTSGDPADDAHIVMDTNNHGALINADGNFSMRYSGEDYAGTGSASTAQAGQWSHVMVVRADRVNPTSVMYVDGVAIAAAEGDYNRGAPPLGTVNDDPDTAPLVIGGGTGPQSATNQGDVNNYSGIVDDVEMFALGLGPGGDFGEFDFATDNWYAVEFGPSNPLDLAGNDNIVGIEDIAIFVNNWLFEKEINGVVVGDLETVAVGDFNYSGRVDIEDWALLNAANPALAQTAMAMIAGVIPEPGAATLIAVALAGVIARRR